MTVLRSPGSMTGPGRRAGWTPAQIICAVIGALLALCSLGLPCRWLALWASATQRHGGDIDLGTWSYRSTGYAVVSSTADPYGATGQPAATWRGSATTPSAASPTTTRSTPATQAPPRGHAPPAGAAGIALVVAPFHRAVLCLHKFTSSPSCLLLTIGSPK